MRIQVFKRHQDPTTEQPAHELSEVLAIRFVAERLAKYLNPKQIILTSKETFQALKARFKPGYKTPITILPVRDWHECLLLYYPHKSQESV